MTATHMLFDRGESYLAGSSELACGDERAGKSRTRDRQAVTCEDCLEAIRIQESIGTIRRDRQLRLAEGRAREALTGPDGNFHEEKSPEPSSQVYEPAPRKQQGGRRAQITPYPLKRASRPGITPSGPPLKLLDAAECRQVSALAPHAAISLGAKPTTKSAGQERLDRFLPKVRLGQESNPEATRQPHRTPSEKHAQAPPRRTSPQHPWAFASPERSRERGEP